MDGLKRNEIPMPQDMEGGKDKIVFGNIQQIYEWHKRLFLKNIFFFSKFNIFLNLTVHLVQN